MYLIFKIEVAQHPPPDILSLMTYERINGYYLLSFSTITMIKNACNGRHQRPSAITCMPLKVLFSTALFKTATLSIPAPGEYSAPSATESAARRQRVKRHQPRSGRVVPSYRASVQKFKVRCSAFSQKTRVLLYTSSKGRHGLLYRMGV